MYYQARRENENTLNNTVSKSLSVTSEIKRVTHRKIIRPKGAKVIHFPWSGVNCFPWAFILNLSHTGKLNIQN